MYFIGILHYLRIIDSQSPATTQAGGPCGFDPGKRVYGRKLELRIRGAAAQTRVVSMSGIRLFRRKSTQSFKGIIRDDISEFESFSIGAGWCQALSDSSSLDWLTAALPHDVFVIAFEADQFQIGRYPVHQPLDHLATLRPTIDIVAARASPIQRWSSHDRRSDKP
jgi:hypothetical protein